MTITDEKTGVQVLVCVCAGLRGHVLFNFIRNHGPFPKRSHCFTRLRPGDGVPTRPSRRAACLRPAFGGARRSRCGPGRRSFDDALERHCTCVLAGHRFPLVEPLSSLRLVFKSFLFPLLQLYLSFHCCLTSTGLQSRLFPLLFRTLGIRAVLFPWIKCKCR